ncbi:hypothetical protein [Streptomyces sp. A0592]|uniref:hypothetical protein n=1 Tax=Streptomyces sp. A0592 TaxID=2563099 RepID=UPI00109EAD9C|nr:hypothetical protein [Streptomyces sp. A0592]THA82753.1 hypothetical protein E6U81_19615 [Streptomyces sp. A0592]
MTDQPISRFACTGPCTRGVCGVSAGVEPCGTCCECRLTCDGPEPATEQPARHTVDTITSDALDQLYAEREQLRAALDHQAQELATWRATVATLDSGAPGTPRHRAEQAEAAIARAREVEEQWRLHFLATGEAAGGHALAMVRAALDEPREPRP